MAQFEHLIPHILRWETGFTLREGETAEQLFERSRQKGYANDPHDMGGATQSGVTLTTYQTYCKRHALAAPSIYNLKQITYKQWRAILKEMYWDRYKGDNIVNQSVADILVDYLWGSGCYAITKVQKALGLKADGIVGPMTISVINATPPEKMFALVRQIRTNHYNAIVKANPSQRKWLRGWMNRLNALTFEP